MKTGERGFSLIELLVSVGVSAFIIIAASSIMLFFIDQATVAMERNEAEESVLWGQYYLKAMLSNAVGLTVAAPPGGNPYTNTQWPAVAGQIYQQYNYNLPNSLPQLYDTSPGTNVIDTLALFSREAGMSASNPNGSSFVDGGLFFQRPVYDAATQTSYAGRLFLVQGQPGAGGIAPTTGDLIADHLTGFQTVWVDRAPNSATNPNNFAAKDAEFLITARYFLIGNNGTWVWCPEGSAGCPANPPPYAEIQADVKIGFRDNVLDNTMLTDTSGTTAPIPQRLFGDLYFFQYHLPAITF